MKRMRILPAVLLSAAMLSGCAYLGIASSSSAAPAYSQNQTSSAAAKTSSAVPAQSTASAASASQATASGTDSAQVTSPEQNGAVKTVTTDSAAFDAKFSENPLDKAYVADMQLAVSTLDMVQVSNKYTGLWQKEIENAGAQMKTALASDEAKLQAFTDEQANWEDGKDAAIAKISAEASAAGGSMGRVDAASAVMEYYRARAAAVYRQVYDYNKDYTYAYGT